MSLHLGMASHERVGLIEEWAGINSDGTYAGAVCVVDQDDSLRGGCLLVDSGQYYEVVGMGHLTCDEALQGRLYRMLLSAAVGFGAIGGKALRVRDSLGGLTEHLEAVGFAKVETVYVGVPRVKIPGGDQSPGAPTTSSNQDADSTSMEPHKPKRKPKARRKR